MSSGFTVHSLLHNFNTCTAVLLFTCSMRDLLCQIKWSCIILEYTREKGFNLLSLIMFCEDTYFNFVNLHSKYTNVYHVYMLHKRIVRIVSSLGPKSSCRNLLKELDVLPPSCQYILPLKMFALDNQKNFQTNFSVHGFVFAYC